MMGAGPEWRQVRFRNGGGIGGKPRLAPLTRTPRSEPVKSVTVSVKKPNKNSQPSDGTEIIKWRPQKDGLLTEDLKEKLRPVLEHRMPTLITKSSFNRNNAQISAIQPCPSFMGELLDSPPRTMRDVRAAVHKQVKALTRQLLKIERAYYGENGNVEAETERYAYSIKMLMKSLMVFDLNNAAAVDDIIKLASNPASYIGEPKYLADLKEIYTKVQTFLPDMLSNPVEKCQALLSNVVRYCVSFYEPDADCYLETADHYSEQIATWKERAEISIQSAKNLYKRFQTAGVTIKMLSSPVATFSSRNSLQRVLFLVLCADACTHLRNALEQIKAWVKADENYSTYVKNDLTELEALKAEKVRNLRDYRQKYHSLTFKLTQLETDYAKLAVDLNTLREREGHMRIEEVYLVNQKTDIERQIEIKERKREQLKRLSPIYGPAPSPEPQIDTVEGLSSDLKALRDRLPLISRQLIAIRHKLSWIDDRMNALEKISNEIRAIKKELKQVEVDRGRKEKEYSEVDRAVEVAKRILVCKTANDSVEKLYYSVPVAAKATKVLKAKEEIVPDPVERACKIVYNRVNRDWINLYRNLPFHPQRGSETISQDIVDLTDSGARVSSVLVARRSLDRWRRHHTRASVDDIRQALKKIKRTDILKVIDLDLNPPPKVVQAPFEAPEETEPPVEPHLIPFYKQIERYDQLRANRKIAEIEAANRKAMKQKALALKQQNHTPKLYNSYH